MTSPTTNKAEIASGPALREPQQGRLLELGFSLSGQALHLLGSPPNRRLTAASKQPAPDELAPHLHGAAERITDAIQEQIQRSVEQSEIHPLEELQHSARSLVVLLYGGKKPEAMRYSDMLAQSVLLLRERVRTDRWQWLGLLLAAEALLVMARAGCQVDTGELLGELRVTDEQARRELLDHLIPYLSASAAPWSELAAFFYGEENQLLSWAQSAVQQTAEARAGQAAPTPAQIRDALTALEPCQTLFYGEHIPEKKLHNARATCAVPPEEPIIALLDCTVFGSAKDAVVFGAQQLYFCNFVGMSQQPGHIAYSELVGRRLSAEKDYVDLGQGLQCYVVGSNISAEQMLRVLDRLRGGGAGDAGSVSR